MEREAKTPTRAVNGWAGMLERGFTKHAYISESYIKQQRGDLLIRLASIPALFGSMGEEQANSVYYAMISLFANVKRRVRWSKTVDLIPADKIKIRRIVECVNAYSDHVQTRTGLSLREDNFKLDRVVKVMMQVKNADTYVRDCVGNGMFRAGQIFHPNSLQYAKDKYKGVYGYGEDEGYYSKMKDKVDRV